MNNQNDLCMFLIIYFVRESQQPSPNEWLQWTSFILVYATFFSCPKPLNNIVTLSWPSQGSQPPPLTFKN